MPPADVIALHDKIQAGLENRDFAGLGPIAVGGGASLPDAELVARILLADVEHWAEREHWDHQVSPARWDRLAEDLRAFLREVERLRAAR